MEPHGRAQLSKLSRTIIYAWNLTMGLPCLPVRNYCIFALGKTLHDENGKFAIGHPKVGGVKKGYRTVRHYRNKLMEQLAPFIESMGEIIEAIDDPSDKVLAVSRIIKYAMPSLSSVDFKENTKETCLIRLSMRKERKGRKTDNIGVCFGNWITIVLQLSY